MTGSDNRAYWSANLDPRNLGGDAEFRRELDFALPPDWTWATEYLMSRSRIDSQTDSGPLLDLGAGLGVQSVLFAQAGWSVVAADLALPRLQSLQVHVSQTLGSDAPIWPVLCRAEALPFRRQSLGGVATRSVLIHTDLEATAGELARTLVPGGQVAIAEPLTSNPLVCLYRATLAPREWQSITRYFDPAGRETTILQNHFGALEKKRWYLLGFLAFGFQFALRSPWLWKISLSVLSVIDGMIHRLAPRLFENRAWFMTYRGKTSVSEAVAQNSPANSP